MTATDMSFNLVAASVTVTMRVSFGVGLVVWGRTLLLRPNPTPRFARRWERSFMRWGVFDTNTPADIRSQLVVWWWRMCGRQFVNRGVASLRAAGVALLGLEALRDLLPGVSSSVLFIPTICSWFLALIICMGITTPFGAAHREQVFPSADSHKPWRLLLMVPALCVALSLAYLSLLALLSLGALAPDPSWYRFEVTAPSSFWVLWVAPIVMLLAAGLAAYFIVQAVRQCPIHISGDPTVDQRAASKLRDYQLFRLGTALVMLSFIPSQAEMFLMPLHSSDVTAGILTWLMFAGFAIALVGFVYAFTQAGGWMNGASGEGDSLPIPASAN